jgi:hypothetical protein
VVETGGNASQFQMVARQGLRNPLGSLHQQPNLANLQEAPCPVKNFPTCRRAIRGRYGPRLGRAMRARRNKEAPGGRWGRRGLELVLVVWPCNS